MVDEEEDIFLDLDQGEKEEPEDDSIEIDDKVALAMAAETLLLARDKAEMLNDTAALLKIAGGFMELHEYLAGGHTHEDKKLPMGFASAKPAEQEEVEELDDAVATESKSKRRVYAQHGKLRVTATGYRRRG